MENGVSIVTNTDAEEDIALQDRWIYTEMAQNYFGSDRMKDSQDCNYTLLSKAIEEIIKTKNTK